MDDRIITIMIVVDVIGTLASDTLAGNIYFFDDNRIHGSVGQGTEHLKTKLANGGKGFTILWNVMPIEPESFAGISRVAVDPKYLQVEKKNYKGSDIAYWTGVVREPIDRLTYQVSIKVGHRDLAFSCNLDFIS